MGVLWVYRRQVSQLEEGDVGTLHPIYQVTCQPWITFMAKVGKYYLSLPLFSTRIVKIWSDGLHILMMRSFRLLTLCFCFFSFWHGCWLIGCPSIQQCSSEIASQFLLPSILAEIVNLVSSLASDTTVKAFEKRRWVAVLGMRWVSFWLIFKTAIAFWVLNCKISPYFLRIKSDS